MSWYYLDLTFDLAVVTLTYKILYGVYLGYICVGSCHWVGTLARVCRCKTSWYDLDLTFDLAVVTLTYNPLSGLYFGIHNV